MLIFFMALSMCVEISQKKLKVSNRDEEAVEFKLGETMIFNVVHNNYFKLKNDKVNKTVFFSFEREINYINLKDPQGNIEEVSYSRPYTAGNLKMILDQEGDYYFEIKSNAWFFNLDNSFTTFVAGEIIETIDLNKKFILF